VYYERLDFAELDDEPTLDDQLDERMKQDDDIK
jgi:hypothetical protein